MKIRRLLLPLCWIAACTPPDMDEPGVLPEDVPEPVPGEIGLAGDERPDITRFLNVRTATSPSLSPDATRLAFRTEISGEPQLWVVDASGGWPRQLTFGEPVTFHRWSPAGDWILYAQDRGGDEREGYYLISPDGTRERELLPPSDAFRVFGDFTGDGGTVAYGSTARTGIDFDLHLLDLETGEERMVFEGRMGLYPASFRPDGGAVLLTEARGEDANDVYLFDMAAGRLDTLFAPEDRAYHGGFRWTPEGDAFYLVTNRDREYQALARYDVAGGELRVVEEEEGRDVEGVALSGDGRYLGWTVNDGGYSLLRVQDLRTGREVRAPELPRGIYSLRWAARAPVLAVHVASPEVPGDIWTWDVRTGRTERATRSDAAGLDLSRMVTPEHHSFASIDGLEIHGLLYRPSEGAWRGDGPPPVLMAVHGGPTAQARPRFNPAHQYLLSRGVAILDLNFRGSTGYGKTFARLNDQRLREDELLDLEAAVRWLDDRPDVDGTRVAIMGGSYGGYLAMAGLTRLPDLFRSGVSFVGVSDWITALEGASPQLQASDRIEYGDIHEPDDREFFRRISPIRYVDDIRAPIMVLHGANDPRNPVEESDAFVQAVREVGGRVEYLRFPDEGHSIRRLENRVTAYRRIARFLEETLEIR